MANDVDPVDVAILVAFTGRVEALEAADQSDPRVWHAAATLKEEIEQGYDDNKITMLQGVEYAAHRSAVDALVTRLVAIDATPQYTAYYTELATLEGAFPDRASFIANGYRSTSEAFACLMEQELRSANAQAPEDPRAVEKLTYLARRARNMVFAR